MHWKTLCLQPITLNLLLLATLTQVGITLQPSWAESEHKSKILQALNYDPPLRGAPGDRGDAGSRSPFDFMVLVPPQNTGITVAERPTFWLYVKTPLERPIPIELELRDQQENVIYQAEFELTQGPGIISLTLPQDAPALQSGQKYSWYFFSYEYELYRFGELERITLSSEVKQQLATATPRERIMILANQGLWYETFTELAELRRAYPQDAELEAAWISLLEDPDVDLNAIVSQPLLGCCTSQLNLNHRVSH